MAQEPTPLTVLLVQPHGDSLDLYDEYLRLQGISCIPVSTVTDALAAAPRASIVVTGIMLEGEADGVELIERLRSDRRTAQTPIVVLTACAFESEQRRAESAGADLFLAKPCLPTDLHGAIRRVVSEARLRDVKGRPVKSTGATRPDAGKVSEG
jgi:CheY-like chemotaxis protein